MIRWLIRREDTLAWVTNTATHQYDLAGEVITDEKSSSCNLLRAGLVPSLGG